MCFQCPQTLPAPNPQFQKLRVILKVLALFMVIVMVFDFVIGYIINALYTGFLVYFLYLGWTTFNWCSVMFFFVYCIIQSVSFLLMLIDRIEHNALFPGKMDTFAGIVIIICLVFYTVSVFVSHYVYRHFKNYAYGESGSSGMGSFMPMSQPSVDDGYSPFQSSSNNIRQQNSNNNSNQRPTGFNAFQGAGVRIG